MNRVIIVQARIGSTRLPGKVLLEVLGRPLLSYQIERLKRVKRADQLLIATTTNQLDDPIVSLCKREKIACFRGEEDNVLDRYLQAAKENAADIIIRITADCPLIDPLIVDRVIQFFEGEHYDYVSNTLVWSWPRGMDVEVFTKGALFDAAETAKSAYDKEHVTAYFYNNPELFRLGSVEYEKNASHLRLTVDTKKDFQLIEAIIERLYPKNPKFTFEEILALFEREPDLIKINADVQQK